MISSFHSVRLLFVFILMPFHGVNQPNPSKFGQLMSLEVWPDLSIFQVPATCTLVYKGAEVLFTEFVYNRWNISSIGSDTVGNFLYRQAASPGTLFLFKEFLDLCNTPALRPELSSKSASSLLSSWFTS